MEEKRLDVLLVLVILAISGFILIAFIYQNNNFNGNLSGELATIGIFGANYVNQPSSFNLTDKDSIIRLNVTNSAPYGNLIGYWGFDMDSNTAYDFSINGYDGSYGGNAFSNSNNCLTNYGDCLQLDGSQDYVSIGDNNKFDFGTGNFTASFWVAENDIGRYDTFISKDDCYTGSHNGIYIYMQHSNLKYMYWNGVTDTIIADRSSDWHMISAIRNGTGSGQVSLYYDGVLVNTATDSRNMDNSYPLIIGDSGDANSLCSTNGQMDEVMIFNKSLTSQQIVDIYNNQSLRFLRQGEMNFTNINLGTNASANVSVNGGYVSNGGYLSASFNNGEVNFTGLNASNVSIINGNDSTLTLRFYANQIPFFSPILNGNLSIDGNGALIINTTNSTNTTTTNTTTTNSSSSNSTTTTTSPSEPIIFLNNTNSTGCQNSWACGTWEKCINGIQNRTCFDLSNCIAKRNKPATNQTCVIENAKEVETPVVEINKTSQTKTKEYSSKVFYFIVAIILVIIVLVGYGIIYFWRKDKKNRWN